MESIRLNNGEKYRGQIVVDSPIGVPTSLVKKQLEDIGFKDLIVWNDPRDLPDEWPDEDKKESDEFMVQTFWAEGLWDGEDGQEAVTSGDNWTMAWIREIDTPEESKYEQTVPSGKWGWLPIVAASAVNSLAVMLWIKASKE